MAEIPPSAAGTSESNPEIESAAVLQEDTSSDDIEVIGVVATSTPNDNDIQLVGEVQFKRGTKGGPRETTLAQHLVRSQASRDKIATHVRVTRNTLEAIHNNQYNGVDKMTDYVKGKYDY